MSQPNTTPIADSIADLAASLPGAEFLPKEEKSTVQAEPEAGEETTEGGDEPEAGDDPDPEAEPEVVVDSGDEPESFDENKPQNELIADFQHRIGRVTAKRKEAEQKVEQLEGTVKERDQEIARLKQNPPAAAPVPTAENPLADVGSLEALQKRMADAAHWQQMAIRNPEGFTAGEGEGAITLDAEQVRDLLAKATATLTIHGPQRAQYLNALTAKDAETKTTFPDLYDSTKPDHQEAQNLLAAWPELRRFPDHMEVIGFYIAGRKATEAALKAKDAKPPGAKPAVKKVPLAPPGPKPGSGGAVVPAKQVTKTNAEAKVLQSGGSRESLESFFDA